MGFKEKNISDVARILIEEKFPENEEIWTILECNYEKFLKAPETFSSNMRRAFKLYEIALSND
jgi:hypothetical protein